MLHAEYPELDQRILEWFTEQRTQGKFFVEQQKQDHEINQSADCRGVCVVECVTLKTIVVSCDNIVYERLSLASFHKCQNKFKSCQIFNLSIVS